MARLDFPTPVVPQTVIIGLRVDMSETEVKDKDFHRRRLLSTAFQLDINCGFSLRGKARYHHFSNVVGRTTEFSHSAWQNWSCLINGSTRRTWQSSRVKSETRSDVIEN